MRQQNEQIQNLLAQQRENLANLQRITQQPQPRREENEPLYERFRRQKPTEFKGTPDPLVAEEWIKSLEVIFDYMELDDRQCVTCAVPPKA